VSIIVLNYNGDSIIEQCLDALLNQSYPRFEIVVVDNDSRDRSLHLLRAYLPTGIVTIIRSTRNLGVAGGRNLGLTHAKGEIVAFIDNDGFAHRDWLKEGVNTLRSASDIGAVAPLVFFARNKLILNGAGGTLNLRGSGGDLCFNTPFEFASIPQETLYPMGCGMIVRRNVLDQIGNFDSLLFNYYDDADLGIRIWKCGYKVKVSARARVDHDFGYTDGILGNKILLCERNRVRTVLKYFKLRYLPKWLFYEVIGAWHYFHSATLKTIPLKVWSWNLLHLPSALLWRARFVFKRGSFRNLLEPSWAEYPPPRPNNQALRPKVTEAKDTLIVNGFSEVAQLHFGWHYFEQDGGVSYRWTERHASALISLRAPTNFISLELRGSVSSQHLSLQVRILGEIVSFSQLEIVPLPGQWQQCHYRWDLPAREYQLLLSVNNTFRDPSGRSLGVAISSIVFS
jgi:GT2 family glycosyltransferase